MSEKCNPNYQNLNTVKSYGEQKQATVQWADQVCANDEYLKQEVDELNYRSPARIRKRWQPILVDDQNSYGYTVNPNKTVTFSELLSDNVTIDFSDFSMIDVERSDCDFKIFKDGNNVQHKCATIPMVKTGTSITTCRNLNPGDSINSFWYCGFDKNKEYHIRPDWIKDWKDSEIPSVCRAQTITIPNGVTNGILYSVDLRIENNGTNNSNWGSPLYVQIWKTKPVTVEKTYWDNNKKKSVSYNPKRYETIHYPTGTPETALATAVYEPTRIEPHLQNFTFDKKITVNSGEHYAIVMMSPLSHWEHCPRIGGWGRNCDFDKYAGGDAFLSENNGQTWQRYGKNDTTVNQYRMGMYTPLDFAFVAHIGVFTDGYAINEDFYLYLKPIQSNPIKSVQLVPVGYGNEAQESAINMEFQVSKSGKANSWVTLDANELSINFNRDPNTGEYPHFAFIRVKMKTTDSTKAPYLDSLKVIYEMDIPKEMYVRTIKYNPKTSPMLGASAWSKFFSRFETDPQVRGSVELISEKIGIEHFSIITAQELENYTYIDGLDDEKLTDVDLSVRYEYLMNDANALDILKGNKVYVKPYTYIKNGQSITHKMSFSEGIKFDNSPSYPIISAELNPYGNANEIPLAEWIDYSFDYDKDQLIFNEIMNQYSENGTTVYETMSEYLPVGTLEVAYHPIFIQNLSANDVGIREDSEGFVLDYFKEERIIEREDVENRYIPIKFPSCDPIRSLVIDDKEYIEDIHFTVDYIRRRIKFPIIDIDNSSTLLTENQGKEMYVVYTPNIEDPGLIMAYRGVREDTSQQMRIFENYIEYKV
ncbi:hypothetical protein [Methanobrevibacter sp.]|uniref:hypothetical protein n=1 Tax=Methanobrevibacter sp. TaxID=66852 RepID=UPI00388E8BEF